MRQLAPASLRALESMNSPSDATLVRQVHIRRNYEIDDRDRDDAVPCGLHRFVRLRWGFLDDVLPAEWAHPGDPLLYDILTEANRKDSSIDLVVGSAPGWSDPWSRAMSVQIVRLEYWTVAVRQGDEVFEINRHDIQAVRPSRGFGLVTPQ